MNNHEALNVMYVIWGQKIWNPSNGEAPTPWENWRDMEDRGSVTDNHWYVLSISNGWTTGADECVGIIRMSASMLRRLMVDAVCSILCLLYEMLEAWEQLMGCIMRMKCIYANIEYLISPLCVLIAIY